MKRLKDVESYIQERPDSALSELSKMTGTALKGRRSAALHALLLSQALDKNYVDVADDSIIQIAVDYYGTGRDERHAMLAQYYAGRVAFNRGDYQRSLVCGTIATSLAESLGDDYSLGLIRRMTGDSYSLLWNSKKAVDLYRRAGEAFMRAGKWRHAAFADLSVAGVYLSEARFDDCLSKLDSISRRYGEDDIYLQAGAHAYRSVIASHSGKDRTALSEFRKWQAAGVMDNALVVYSSISLAFQRQGQPDSAAYYLSQARQAAVSEDDIRQCESYLGDLLYIQKDYQGAYDKLKASVASQNKTIVEHLGATVDMSVSRYWQQETETRQLKLQNSRNIILFVCILSVLTLALLLLYAMKKRRDAAAYYDQLLSAHEDIERLVREGAWRESAFKKYIHKRQVVINSFIHLYCDGGGKSSARIRTGIEDLMDSVRYGQAGFTSMEADLNDMYAGVLVKLREAFKDISREDYMLLVYWFYGFSQETVSLLSGRSVSALYNLKSSWKNRFSQLGSDTGDLFLSLMTVSRAKRGL